MPPDYGSYQVEVIDIWEQTITIVKDSVEDKVRVALPEKEGIAVLMLRK